MEWVDALKSIRNYQIVLLIDEYDSPVTSFLVLPTNPQMTQAVSEELRNFYQAIKGYEAHFHKVFVTGISKFSRSSMISGPNQFIHIMEENAKFCTFVQIY